MTPDQSFNADRPTPPHLLAFDLLHSEVVTLHGVAPALAVPPARKRRGLGALAEVCWGQRPRLTAKADGALQMEESD